MADQKDIWIITMNMPSHSGNLVHQIICDAPRWQSEAQVIKDLKENQFLILDEMYKDNGELYFHGKVMINTGFVGKVKRGAVGNSPQT